MEKSNAAAYNSQKIVQAAYVITCKARASGSYAKLINIFGKIRFFNVYNTVGSERRQNYCIEEPPGFYFFMPLNSLNALYNYKRG